ncbi:MAG: response regulator [Anaerolineales bacterium]
MEHVILLVDDNRDVLKLLRSTLDSLKKPELKILEAPSGEEAMLESSRKKIDLLITDFLLPGMNGVELMHKVRARHPEVKVILISGISERKTREQMLNAGALAVFNKPVPIADFLDSVERGLGLVRTIFPPEKVDEKTEARHARISDLLANFRQDFNAQAVFLINDRGLVQARAGSLADSSLEVSTISALMAIHHAGLKVAKNNHQEVLDSYHVFRAGDNDLIFIPVNPMYALLVAGDALATEDRILETVNGVSALRKEAERALKSMGMTGELHSISPKTIPIPPRASEPAPEPSPKKQTDRLSAPPAPEMEALLKDASAKKAQPSNVDDFWNQAAEQHGKKPSSSKVLTLEQAKQMGLLDEGKQ